MVAHNQSQVENINFIQKKKISFEVCCLFTDPKGELVQCAL